MPCAFHAGYCALLAGVLTFSATLPLRAADEDFSARIDKFIFNRLAAEKVAPAPLASDSEFLRRVYLDLTGRLPTADQARAFLNSTEPDKRDKLIDSLFPALPTLGIGRRLEAKPFLDRWAYFFSDLFRNNEQLREGAPVFHGYLYKNLELNVPYDVMVRDMITATALSTWTNGAANFVARHRVMEGDGYSKMNHEDTCDELAISTTKLFLGVNTECISCHDGANHLEKVNLWLSKRKRSEVWNQAAFFGTTYVAPSFGRFPEFTVTDTEKGYDVKSKSVVRMPRSRAEVSPTFLLTSEKLQPGDRPREAYARMITNHPQFARATVNLFWAELMGQGIVDPPLSFDLDRQDPKNPPPAPWTIQPSHPELLDALAEDFRKHNYDLRYLMRTIVRSRAYQLSAAYDGKWNPQNASLFARRKVRRLPAEQLWDAISQATGKFEEFKGQYHVAKYNYLLQSPFFQDYQGSHRKLYDLLQTLGQTDREELPQDRSSLMQVANLLNHKLVTDRVTAAKGSNLETLLSKADDDEIIDQLFLRTLSRLPDNREREVARRAFKSNRTEGAEDLLWALINRVEFLFY
jgi:hypothetical protein